MLTQLFTAGYSGHTLESFLEILHEHEIEVLVDVREKPMSRKPGFSRSRLSDFLEDNEVEYRHAGELGVPKEMRTRLRAGSEQLGGYFRQFREYLGTQREAIDALHELTVTKRCCLMCLEARAEQCHRSVVAEVVASRNGETLEILHL